MLLRMYVRWAERHDYGAEVLDVSPGEEAGIKSAIVEVKGDYAFGYLKGEHGVHRLVRLSPFDADHARHTLSFWWRLCLKLKPMLMSR
jgi:peptide chain release factor 2